jgi:hypothetical protein
MREVPGRKSRSIARDATPITVFCGAPSSTTRVTETLRSTSRPTRAIPAWLGAFPIFMGAVCAGIGCGWIPYDPAKVHAPGWVIVVCGISFIGAGLAILSTKWSRDGQPQAIYGFMILAGLTVVCNWVAFGAGERHFSSSTSINGAKIASHPVDERNGRIVFGVAALILDLMLVAGVVRLVRRRRSEDVDPAAIATRERPSPRPGEGR